jgi:hypothetical protein
LRSNAFTPNELNHTEHLKIGDIFLWFLILRNNKKGYYLDEVTAIYRLHSGGIYSTLNSAQKKYNEIEVFNFMKNKDLFSRKEIGHIKFKLMNLWYDILVNHTEKNRLKSFSNLIKNYSLRKRTSFLIVLKAIFKIFKNV